MNTTAVSSSAVMRARRPSVWRAIASLAVIVGLALVCPTVHAQQLDPMAMPGEPGAANFDLNAILATDEYVPSPSFNGGRFYFDHFAGPTNADQVGAVAAEMPNGDIVVAGLVPAFGASGTCNNGTDLCHIGLVRYNTNGVRVAWSNPLVWGHFNNNYVIYPGGSNPFYQYIRDVKVRNGRIYVMVDTATPATGLGRQNVVVVGFNGDGSIFSSGTFAAFGFASSGDMEDFYGAQIVFINDSRMIVTATAYDSIGPYVAVNRMIINPNGTMAQDPAWGSQYGGGGTNSTRVIRYYAPNGFCLASNCNAIASYAVGQIGFTFGDVYIAGSLQYDGNDWDVFALKISSESGAVKTEFTPSGWRTVNFAQPGSNSNDRSAGIYVFQDDIYLAAQAAQKCYGGIGMAKINGAGGTFITAFGGTGRIVFGGQGNDPICFQFGGASVPFAISATGGRIGIAGYIGGRDFNSNSFQNPMLAVVNAVNGEVLDRNSHPVRRADGSRYGDAVLYSVFGGSNPTSPFTVAGNGRDTNNGNTSSYVTGRLIPVSADRIFANGFD